MKFLWIDTETTGTDPVKHGIVQIAGMIYVNGAEMERFNLTCRPHPDDVIEEEALKVHGRIEEEIKNYPEPRKVYDELLSTFSKYINKFDRKDKFIVAGKNVRFDIEFLNEFFKKNGKPHPKYNCPGDPFFFSWVKHSTLEVETLAILYEITKGKEIFEDYKLGTLCEYCGIALDNAHDAMADIDATRNLGRHLMKRIIGKGK